MVEQQSEVEQLRAEVHRLRQALAVAGIDADRIATERSDSDAQQGTDLAISRAETSVARAEVKRGRSDAAAAEQRHDREAIAAASALASSRDLVGVLLSHDRRQAALIELGDRLRDIHDRTAIVGIGAEVIARAIDARRAGYGIVDQDRETVTIDSDWCAPGVASIAGSYRFRDFGSYIDELKRGETVAIDDVAADARTRDQMPAFAALAIRSLLNVPVVEGGRLVAVGIVQHDATHLWTIDELAFVTAAADRVRAAIALVEAQGRQAMLNGEIAHRLKNTLAIVQAIVAQTLRRASSMTEARKALSDRLLALGKAHDALMAGRTDATTVGAVVEAALTLHNGQGERIAARGVEVEVGPSAALSLALMLHELATNATKYGALSTATGHVDLTWVTMPGIGGETFVLTWTERGGPPVAMPTRRGFGSQLIERGFGASAKVSVAYDPSGVVATLQAPLASLQSGITAR